jgi:hypothetical protein
VRPLALVSVPLAHSRARSRDVRLLGPDYRYAFPGIARCREVCELRLAALSQLDQAASTSRPAGRRYDTLLVMHISVYLF